MEETRVVQVADLKPGACFIIESFGQGFVIRQDPDKRLTDVLLEASTHSRAVIALSGNFIVEALPYGKDYRLEQYQDALTYPELLRAYQQEQETVQYLLNQLHEAQSRAQAAEARVRGLEEQLEGMVQPAMEE